MVTIRRIKYVFLLKKGGTPSPRKRQKENEKDGLY